MKTIIVKKAIAAVSVAGFLGLTGSAVAFAVSPAPSGKANGTQHVLCQRTGNGGQIVVSNINDDDNKNRRWLATHEEGIHVQVARELYGAKCDAMFSDVPPTDEPTTPDPTETETDQPTDEPTEPTATETTTVPTEPPTDEPTDTATATPTEEPSTPVPTATTQPTTPPTTTAPSTPPATPKPPVVPPKPKPVITKDLVQEDTYRYTSARELRTIKAYAADKKLTYREDKAQWNDSTWRIIERTFTNGKLTSTKVLKAGGNGARAKGSKIVMTWKLGKGATVNAPWGVKKNIPQTFVR